MVKMVLKQNQQLDEQQQKIERLEAELEKTRISLNSKLEVLLKKVEEMEM